MIVELCQSTKVAAKQITALRRELGDELAELIVSVAQLQKRARRKLAPPDCPVKVWWITSRSLQQATAWQVARLKSGWYPSAQTVHDLCCGAGGDALHFAMRGGVVAVDSDPQIAEMAAANLRQLGKTAAPRDVRCGDATKLDVPSGASIHIDPDRRVNQSRTTRVDHYQPPWDDVRRLIENSHDAVVKLAPAASVPAGLSMPTHRCWISLGGTVREQSLLCGSVVERAGLASSQRSGVRLSSSGEACWYTSSVSSAAVSSAAVSSAANSSAADLSTTSSLADSPSKSAQAAALPSTVARKPGSWLIDPDPSIRAAGLTEAFARDHQLEWIGSPAGYLTSEDRPASLEVHSMSVVGRVIWVGACDDRKLRRELRQRNLYPDTIKVRGTDHDPNVLTKRYRQCGEVPATIWIGRSFGRAYAAITQPDPGDDPR